MNLNDEAILDTIDNQLAWLEAMSTMQFAPAFKNDPVREVHFAATIFGSIVGHLQGRGFLVPEVPSPEDDPIAFCQEAAAVLRKFRPFLLPFVRSLFAPQPPELQVQ